MSKMIISILLFLSINVSADFVIKNGIVEFVETKSIPASKRYAKACEKGDINGCTDLGLLYFTGDDVKEDHEKAKKLFELACNNRNSKACYYLGTIYKRGSKYMNGSSGIEKNLKKSKKFYAKGCLYRYAQSCEQYNLIKEKGESTGSSFDNNMPSSY